MLLLLFIIFLIQFFVYWIFEPISHFLTSTLELRFLPIIALLLFLFLFTSEKNNVDL